MRFLLFLLFFLLRIQQFAAIPFFDFTADKRCLGDSTVFTDLSCCNIDIWEWDFGDPASGAANHAYAKLVKHKYASTGTYTVTLRLGSGVITDTIVRQVVICIPQKPILSFHDTTICNGNSVYLYSINTFSKYYWNTGDTLRGLSIKNQGTFILCGTNCDSSCLVCDTARIIVLNKPIAYLSKFSSSCLADSFELNAHNSGFRFVWSNGDTTQKTWIKQDGWYSVKIYNANCFIFDSTYFAFAKRLLIEFKTDTIACQGDTILLNPGWGFTQVWWNNTDTNHMLKVYASGIYPLKIYYLGCYIDTFAKVTFINTAAINLPADTTLCEGDTLTITPAISTTQYWWSNGDTTKSTKIYTSGKTWLRASFNGCNQSDTIVVNIIAKPKTNSIAKVYTCDGMPGTITIPNAAGDNFKWWDGNTKKSRTFIDSGWHRFELSNACFLVEDSAYNGYYPASIADRISPIEICFEDDSVLNLTAKPASSYWWKPENDTNRTIRILSYGWHSVVLTDSLGCRSVDSYYVSKKCEQDTLFIPNVFSPNADGKNDVFKPTMVRYTNYLMRIYNRWGELMFSTNNINEGWDGKYHATQVPEDIYIYLVEVSGYGKFRELKGTLHLIR